MKNILYVLLTLSAVLSFCSCTSPNDTGTELLYKTTEPYKTEQSSVDEISTAFPKTYEAVEHTEQQITAVPTTEQTTQSTSTSAAPTTQQEPASTTSSDIIVVPNKEYQKEQNGMLLTVSLPESIECGEEFILVAKITNTTEESITYTLPTGTPDMHYEIRTKITDGKDFFTDRDTSFKVCDTMERNATLNPGETFEQTMHFIPGLTKNGHLGLDNADIIMFKRSTYNGTAEFRWNTDSGTESLVLEFPVIIK